MLVIGASCCNKKPPFFVQILYELIRLIHQPSINRDLNLLRSTVEISKTIQYFILQSCKNY